MCAENSDTQGRAGPVERMLCARRSEGDRGRTPSIRAYFNVRMCRSRVVEDLKKNGRPHGVRMAVFSGNSCPSDGLAVLLLQNGTAVARSEVWSGLRPMMRIRIIRSPPIASIDGIQLDRFEVGQLYWVGSTIGTFFLAERWAEPVSLEPQTSVSFDKGEEFDSDIPNRQRRRSDLIREPAPPSRDQVQTEKAKRRSTLRRKR